MIWSSSRSESKTGLQACIDKASNFAKSKHLTINVKKSKTMVFNTAGKFIRDSFTLGNETLEPVQSFCYLGVDIKCSGTVKHAANVLSDKGNKALRPLFYVQLPDSISLQRHRSNFFIPIYPQYFCTILKTCLHLLKMR